MGQRLNIEIKINGKVRANAYYHWSGYTQTAKNITLSILKGAYKFLDGDPTLRAIRLLEISGAGLTDSERCEALKMYPETNFSPCEGRNEGLIAITPETSEQEINGVRVVKNTDENRLQLFFDGKPNAEMITKLKGAAFRWSPRNKAWQRVLTDNAVAAANRILAQ